MTAKYDNTDRWRHFKHFVDTHPYSEDNLEYLKTWITHFTAPPKESWVGVDDPNQNSYLMNNGSTHSPPKESEVHIMETDCSQNVSDNPSEHTIPYENVSDKNQLDVEIGCGVLPVYTKKMKLRIPKEVKDALDAVGRSDSLPRTKKGEKEDAIQ